jgi:hypothetical protein
MATAEYVTVLNFWVCGLIGHDNGFNLSYLSNSVEAFMSFFGPLTDQKITLLVENHFVGL